MNNRDAKPDSPRQNGQPAIHRRSRFITSCLLMLTLVFSFADCKKKSKEEEDEEMLPQLGRCEAVAIKSRLTFEASTGIYTYRTSGGGTITVNPYNSSLNAVTLKYDSYPAFYLELWGYIDVNGKHKLAATHESLVGKHIKDRLAERRTIILPDGAKVTLITNGAYGVVNSVSIYDVDESHHINLNCDKLEYSSTNQSIAQKLDDAEADGETAGIEITATGLLFVNLYTENTAGNKVMDRFLLGELFRNNPNHVNDYYDDPRLGAT